MGTIAEYISIRLKELLADHLFCVPGNYSAEFLLAAEKADIRCIKTTNELEAGYAADAYSRYRGIGVCSVTYGVGSQSAYNAIAGGFVEFCPIVLINGSPPLAKVENLRNRNILFAHAIDPLRTDKLIFEPVTVASAEITSANDAPAEIDRVLQACITQGRPVYLEVHQGVWNLPCDPPVGRLAKISTTQQVDLDQIAATDAVVKVIIDRVARARHPVLWGGEMLQRLGLADDFETLVQQAKVPYTTTLMGKGLIPENLFQDKFIGVYDSKFTRVDIKTVVEGSDCLIGLGTLMSDFYADIVVNSELHESLILAVGNAVHVGATLYTQVPLERLLPRLIAEWPALEQPHDEISGLTALVKAREAEHAASITVAARHLVSDSSESEEEDAVEPSPELTWDSFFLRMNSFLTSDMIALTDTSLALFPSAELPVNRRGGYLAQTAWLSIGYTCGAALGVALAEPEARPVVFVGDGGFQMCPQSFSTLVKHTRNGHAPIVFVMDNGLYGVEQFLIDEQILSDGERFYRDKAPEPSRFDVLEQWNYEKLGDAFHGQGFAVTTLAELESCLGALVELQVPALVAVRFDPHNLPRGIQAAVSTPRSMVSLLAGIAGTADSPSTEQTLISLSALN